MFIQTTYTITKVYRLILFFPLLRESCQLLKLGACIANVHDLDYTKRKGWKTIILNTEITRYKFGKLHITNDAVIPECRDL